MGLRPLALAALGIAMAPSVAIGQEQNTYRLAVEARLAGDPTTSVHLLQDWIAQHPEDADAHVQLGYALLALGEFNDAEVNFRAALTIAPDYADASQGIAELARRRQQARSEGQSFLLFEGGFATLASGQRNWRDLGATLVLPIAQRGSLEWRSAWYERFGFEDAEATVLYTHHAKADTWLRAGAGVTPSADFRPEISLTAGLDHRLWDGPQATVLGVDGTWRRYRLQDVLTVSPVITQYLDGRFSITARPNALVTSGDNLRLGGTLRGDYSPGNRTRVFFGLAAGPDLDLGIVTDTHSVFGGAEAPLGSYVSLSGNLAREWREGPSDRTEFRIGLKVGL